MKYGTHIFDPQNECNKVIQPFAILHLFQISGQNFILFSTFVYDQIHEKPLTFLSSSVLAC